MTLPSNSPVSSYLDYLPAVLQDDEFLGQFLLAFEAILSGVKDRPHLSEDKDIPAGFEHTLANIHTYFSATNTPPEFLSWLAGWVALSLRDDWDEHDEWNEKVKRDFIQRIVPLYQQRGTPAALKKMLQIYLQRQVESTDQTFKEYVEIFEFDQIPHYFQVQLQVDSQDLTDYRRKETIARAIIEQEKPAHTIYALRILMPTMRLVSETKLREERVAEADISKRRLKLFSASAPPSNKVHLNKTILGTTVAKPQSERPPPAS